MSTEPLKVPCLPHIRKTGGCGGLIVNQLWASSIPAFSHYPFAENPSRRVTCVLSFAARERWRDGGSVSAAGFELSGGVRELAHGASGFSCARRENLCDAVARRKIGHGQADAGAAGRNHPRGAGSLRAGERRMGARRGNQRAAKIGDHGNAAAGHGGSMVQCRSEEVSARVRGEPEVTRDRRSSALGLGSMC